MAKRNSIEVDGYSFRWTEVQESNDAKKEDKKKKKKRKKLKVKRMTMKNQLTQIIKSNF